MAGAEAGMVGGARSLRLLASYGYIGDAGCAAKWFLPELQATSGSWMWMAQFCLRLVPCTWLSLGGQRGGAPSRLAGLPDVRHLAVGESRRM
jgi:hypothetical protein